MSVDITVAALSSESIQAMFIALVSAPILTSIITYVKDRKKDEAAVDATRMQALRDVIDELHEEITRLQARIKELEEDLRAIGRRREDKRRED